jgi:hypothetical protein
MWGRIQLYAAGAGAFVLALLGIYWRGRSAGAEAERDRQVRRRIEAMQTAKDVRDDVEGDDDLAARAQRWVRDNDK